MFNQFPYSNFSTYFKENIFCFYLRRQVPNNSKNVPKKFRRKSSTHEIVLIFFSAGINIFYLFVNTNTVCICSAMKIAAELNSHFPANIVLVKTYWKRLEDVFSVTFFCLPRCLEDVLKTSWKMSWRRLETSWRRLEDVLKMC